VGPRPARKLRNRKVASTEFEGFERPTPSARAGAEARTLCVRRAACLQAGWMSSGRRASAGSGRSCGCLHYYWRCWVLQSETPASGETPGPRPVLLRQHPSPARCRGQRPARFLRIFQTGSLRAGDSTLGRITREACCRIGCSRRSRGCGGYRVAAG
jgi:hypothetical protein